MMIAWMTAQSWNTQTGDTIKASDREISTQGEGDGTAYAIVGLIVSLKNKPNFMH
jgi:hypothetical protein